MNIASIILIIAFLLQTFSYIPLAYCVYMSKNVNNIPYATLISLFISNIMFILVSLLNGFYYHSILFIIGGIVISWILYMKKYVYIQNQ